MRSLTRALPTHFKNVQPIVYAREAVVYSDTASALMHDNSSAGQPESPNFGVLLRRYRLVAGFTQEELAERAGLSVRATTDLERSVRRTPYPDTVRRMSGALNLEDTARAETVISGRPTAGLSVATRHPGLGATSPP
jgi:DNA-binding XRE family transcriptional regulator